MRRAHGVAVRRDLGRLAQEGHVDVGDGAAARAHAPGRVGQEQVRGRALPARIGVGEMLADVAVADGAEQRIGERVQADVGVGVALQRVGVRNPDAAQPDVIAWREAVHVEALAGAHVGAAVPSALRPWPGPPRSSACGWPRCPPPA